MSQENMTKGFTPPSPSSLMAKYLQKQADAHAAGLADFAAANEVQLYEAGPVQPVDAKLAWDETLVATQLLAADSDVQTWKAPPNWPQLVTSNEPAFAVPFCLGNFPQLVRNLHPLLQAKDVSALRGSPGTDPLKTPALVDWAEKAAKEKDFPNVILAVGCLRAAKHFELAEQILDACDADVPAQWQDVWANEKAALAWDQGDSDGASRIWRQLPESAPVLFNRGMAALFVGNKKEAKEQLTKAVAELPESSAWHYLAQLYLTLAETR